MNARSRLLVVATLIAGLGCANSWTPPYRPDALATGLLLADVDCDGFRDVVVGSPGADRIDIWLWDGAGPAANPVWSAYASERDSGFGSALAAGDVNADGCEDLVIGVEGMSTTYVYLGSTSGLPAEPDWVATGPGGFGRALDAGSDLNEDGFGDVLVGARGSAYAYLGAATGVENTPFWTGTQETARGDDYGFTVLFGDADDDGEVDVIVGDPDYDVQGEMGEDHGRIYFYFAEAPDPPPADPDDEFDGSADRERVGFSLAIGDINGGGRDDLVIGTAEFDDAVSGGRIDVLYGPITNPGMRGSMTGPEPSAEFGWSVSVLDEDGDGNDEVLVGGRGIADNAGETFLYESTELVNQSGPAVWSLAGEAGGDRFGTTVRGGTVDVGADAIRVLLVGAPDSESGGRAYLYRIEPGMTPLAPIWTTDGR